MDAAVSSYRGCSTEHELRVEGAFNSARSIQEGWIKIPDCAGFERAFEGPARLERAFEYPESIPEYLESMFR